MRVKSWLAYLGPACLAMHYTALAASLRQMTKRYYSTTGGDAEEPFWQDSSVMSWAQHMELIGLPGQWGGFADIAALMSIMGCCVDILDENLRRRTIGHTCSPKLGTLLWRRGHYESILDPQESFVQMLTPTHSHMHGCNGIGGMQQQQQQQPMRVGAEPESRICGSYHACPHGLCTNVNCEESGDAHSCNKCAHPPLPLNHPGTPPELVQQQQPLRAVAEQTSRICGSYHACPHGSCTNVNCEESGTAHSRNKCVHPPLPLNHPGTPPEKVASAAAAGR